MDVFSFRDRVVEDYGQFSRSFTTIRADDIREFVDGRYGDEEYWPSPLIQLNPSFVGGGSIGQLVEQGLLHPECRQIFRWGKENGEGQELQLHLHQLESLKIVMAGGCVVITTGTSSGKSIGYILPMVQRIIEAKEAGDKGKRIRAIIIYPMNALCNSQFKELEKYLCLGYPKGSERVTFARYTGQETPAEKEMIQNNPPDILLTNYVMLEYILTRQNPQDQQVIRAAQGLKFLVLDELHTYRGRQGADVAMLVRRVRQRLAPDSKLICIGTSATMASEGSAEERNTLVASVASKLFGTTIPADNVVTETLERVTEGDLPTAEELRQALIEDVPAVEGASLRRHPLARWVELRLGLRREDNKADGKWVRSNPKAFRVAAEELAQLSGIDPQQARNRLREFLLAAYQVEVAPNRRFFAFRLHQFVSAGGDIYCTLEPPGSRHPTLKGQIYRPGSDRQALLFPLVFCRNCGQEFHPVWAHLQSKRPARLEPRDFGDQTSSSDKAVIHGYFMPDAAGAYSIDEPEKANFPDGWLEPGKDGELVLRQHFRKAAPVPCRFRPDGLASTEGLPGWFLSGSFRFCPTCGVEHSARGSDFRKLVGLSSEGRSSATTTLSLSVLRQLLSFPANELPDNARKLLAFSDNRQDASLQAGHFNDFMRVLQLRAGLVAALQAQPEQELSLETLAQETEKALRLEADDFIEQKDIVPAAEGKFRKALREVLEYRLVVDLRRGWRLTNPNLEQLQLLEVDYAELVNCVEDQGQWSEQHPLLAQCSAIERYLICHRLLEELRERLAIETNVLFAEEFERRRRAASELEEVWAIGADEKGELARSVVFETVPRDARGREFRGLEGLSLRGEFGRWLKASQRWRSLQELHAGLKWDEALYQEITGGLVTVLGRYHLVKQVDLRLSRRGSGESKSGWRLSSSRLRWTLCNPEAAPQDEYHAALVKQRQGSGRRGPVNDYFRNLYNDLATTLSEQGRPFLQTLLAREHTAQVDALEREKREEAFREAQLRLLYCSPTMELGVDISSLNTVYMRNVPPTPANYAQRSGRAGRSGQPALVLSYCGATSPHDQYFFSAPTRMVSGAVSAPTLELANEELLIAHFRALWLAATGKALPSKVKELVGLESGLKPVVNEIAEALDNPKARDQALRACQAIVDDLKRHNWLGATPPPWLTESWLEGLIHGTARDFDRSLNRWRGLLDAVTSQLVQAGQDMINYALPEREKKNAEQRQRAALLQRDLLLAERSGPQGTNGDFSTYRYLASQGFMPGYNFPRLPLLAFIPGSREQVNGGTYISRPRFVGISEFGPHSLIYHEGNTYKVRGAILNLQEQASTTTTKTLATHNARVCGSCGHAHLGEDAELEVCCHCGAAIKLHPDGTALHIPNLYQIEQVTTRRAERITSDDEERQRLGYELLTTYEFPKENNQVRVAIAEVSVAGRPLLSLSYGAATQISRINLGRRRRENPGNIGFPIHPVKGLWGKESDLVAGADEEDGESEEGYVKITPYVQDRKNALLVQFRQEWTARDLISVRYALKRAIEVAFQLDPSELAAELMPNEANASALLIYEAAEGGAGVLSRLVESPTAMQQLGRQALEICHWQWEGLLPQQAIDLNDTDEDCEAGCYRCLLSYNNQRDHELIDRRLPSLKQFLLDLARADVVAQGGTTGRSERLDQLLELCQSGLERLWLQTLQQRGYLLPDKAQSPVPDHYVVPDFTYVEAAALVFVDGPHHKQPLQQQLDERKRSALDAAGLNVVVFTDDPRQWDAVFNEYRWLFGEGQGDNPPAVATSESTAAADLGEQIAAVFAQHADKLAGGQPL